MTQMQNRKALSQQKEKYQRLDNEIDGILEDVPTIIAEKNEETGELEEVQSIDSKQYINEKDVINRQNFVLGTDNFGRDVLTELISATGSSLKIGLVAGIIATVIGLFLGLLAGYLGGFVDNLILFFTNLFTVIPSFVLLILISYSVGESQRGIMMVALLIGITAWPWTTRSVRSQVISLRNRDHVNLSKLSGHSMLRIVLTDILPYVASYVVMAFILQISSEFWQSTTFYDRTWVSSHKDCNTWSYDAMGNPVQCTLKRCMVGIFPGYSCNRTYFILS